MHHHLLLHFSGSCSLANGHRFYSSTNGNVFEIYACCRSLMLQQAKRPAQTPSQTPSVSRSAAEMRGAWPVKQQKQQEVSSSTEWSFSHRTGRRLGRQRPGMQQQHRTRCVGVCVGGGCFGGRGTCVSIGCACDSQQDNSGR